MAQNPVLRHVLSRSIRSRDLVWRALGRFAVPAVGLVPPGILGHDPGRGLTAAAFRRAPSAIPSSGCSSTRRTNGCSSSMENSLAE